MTSKKGAVMPAGAIEATGYEVMTATEVMRALRVTRRTVHKLLDSGELRGFQCGYVVRIDARSVDELIGRNPMAYVA